MGTTKATESSDQTKSVYLGLTNAVKQIYLLLINLTHSNGNYSMTLIISSILLYSIYNSKFRAYVRKVPKRKRPGRYHIQIHTIDKPERKRDNFEVDY
jgi:hypothetical protein